MRRLLIAALLAVSPVMAAYSGTFVEDFNDGNLDGWHIEIPSGPPFPSVADFLKLEDGYLVIDPVFRRQNYWVALELRAGDPEKWDSYTLTCHIRFEFKEDPEPPLDFYLEVRRSEGPKVQRDGVTENMNNFQAMWIFADHRQAIHVVSFHPNKGFPAEGNNAVKMTHRAKFSLERLEQPIASRWIPIKIVAKKQFFEFYFDNQLIAEYEDGKARPGTVKFKTNSRMLVHLDDITITGPRVPFIGGPHRVAPEARLATTWGKIKDSPRR